MARYRIQASSTINAPASRIYGILADYREGHPSILPRKYFPSMAVERGGVGAGTIIRYSMLVLGRARTMRAEVSEPEPGRVLSESAIGEDAVTTFTVAPAPDGRGSRVTIATDLPARGLPLLGAVERFVTTRALRPIYEEELALLAIRAESGRPGAGR